MAQWISAVKYVCRLPEHPGAAADRGGQRHGSDARDCNGQLQQGLDRQFGLRGDGAGCAAVRPAAGNTFRYITVTQLTVMCSDVELNILVFYR